MDWIRLLRASTKLTGLCAKRSWTEHGGESFPLTVEGCHVRCLVLVDPPREPYSPSLSRVKRHPILDGNVKTRAWRRVFGIAGDPSSACSSCSAVGCERKRARRQRARRGDYTQAIMDLGATLCTRTRPACTRMPDERNGCIAAQEGRQAELPGR